ncbi:MAG: PqqD family protein [Nitrospirota bacterium]
MKNVYYKKNPSVVCTELEDGAVLLDLQTKFYYSLNQSGLRIWQIINDNKSLIEIVRQITDEYEIDEKSAADSVLRLINKLLKENLVAVIESA